MADELPPLIAILRANVGEFKTAMGEAVSATKKVTDETGKTSTVSKSHFEKVAGAGKAMAAGIVGVGVVVGGAALKMGMDFQESMTSLVTGAGESQKNIGMVGDGILNMAGQVGISSDKLAQGMYMIESAGYHGGQGLDVLRAASEGARVGAADMATVADGLTTALTDYHIPASQAASVTSALVQTVADGKTHLGDLAGSLGNVMPLAAQLGVKFQDVAGGLAAMTNQGQTAQNASQNLNHLIGALGADTMPKAAKALAGVGLSAQQLNDGLKQGLPETLQMVEDAVGKKFPAGSAKYMDALRKILGGQPGLDAALMLSGKNMDAYKANVENIGEKLKGSSKHVEGFAETQKDLKTKLENAKSGVEAMVTKLGMDLIPVVTKVMDVAGKWGSWLAGHKTVLYVVAGIIGTVLVVAIGAYIASMVMAAAATIAATWPILAIIAAIGLVVAAVVFFANHWSSIWGTVKSVAAAVWDWIKDAAASFVHAVFTPIEAALHFIESVWHTVWGGITAAFDAVTGFISDHSAVIVGVIAIIALPISLIIAAVHLLWTHWSQIWGAITAATRWAYDNVIKPVGDGIVNYVFHPIAAVLSWLGGIWSSVWGGIGSAANWVYGNVIRPIGAGIGAVFSGIQSALSWLSGAWSSLWNGIGSALQWVYNHTIGPIVSTIGGAIHGVVSAVSGISNVASSVGHFLGFANGGVVPGPKGAPRLAVVHGGEYVLSNEMQDGRQAVDDGLLARTTSANSYTPARTSTAPAAGGGGGPQVTVYATTNADPHRIAADVGWALRAMA